jgi:aspartyl-tRNA(Asn)/glutamyl-tRNA(Gln) amidotransferase subunit A
VSDPFDKIEALNEMLQFCEDFAASGPVDRAQRLGQGPLAGKVIGLKSNICVKGQAWTAGIGGRAAQITDTDAPVVTSLRNAGAVILSRLAMDEGALGAAGDNPHFGRCENPVFRGHSAGGSSSGPAAAVAAGAVDAALGSDTMGSVRIPAAYCGVYGLKVGSATLSMEGVVPLAPSLDALGLFAKTPSMLCNLLDVLSPASGLTTRMTGWIAPDHSTLTACHPDVLAFFHDSQAALSALLGTHAVLPEMDFAALRSDAFLLTEVEAVTSLGAIVGLSSSLAKLLDYGRRVPSQKLRAAKDRLRIGETALKDALRSERVLMLPSVAAPALKHGARPPVGQADFAVLANIAGLPAISIPKPGALPPVSVQLIGPAASERTLIDLAKRLSDAL